MQTNTQLLGKDVSLEQALKAARERLASSGFDIELVSSKNPVENCWSVHLRLANCAPIYTNGKGGSKLASEASAIYEFFERMSTNLFFADYYLGPREDSFVFYPNEKWFPIDDTAHIPVAHPDGTPLLSESLLSFYNPDGELTADLLQEHNCDGENRGIAALPFGQLDSNETVYFPVSILNNLYLSNGMSAGSTSSECRSQGLSEVIERYVKNRIISEGICLPTVPDEVLARYPKIKCNVDALRDSGFSILIKDASLGGEFPVICVLLINPANGGCFASFGASCRFEVALERTVTELLQGRGLDQLDQFEHPSHAAEAVADPLNLESHFVDSVGLLSWKMLGSEPDFAFSEWDFEGSTAEEYDVLMNCIRQNGFEAYCAEYTHCGVYTCRILVPGMSEVYPIDDLVWSNKVTGASLRPRLLALPTMSDDELQELADDLDELGLNDQQLLSDVLGVFFDVGTAWETLRVGELKGMLALAIGDLEGAMQWYGWCTSFDFLPSERNVLCRAMCDLIGLQLADEEPNDYYASLCLFYNEAIVAEADQLVGGNTRFAGLTFDESWEKVSENHQQFIALYSRVHALKAAAE